MQTLRELRLDSGHTQKTLADLAGVTRHAVLRMEQHVYPTPLPRIIHALSEISGIAETALEFMYNTEVMENRINSGRLWNLTEVDARIFQYDVGSRHPFIGFRVALANRAQQPISLIHFCIAFSIHPYVLSEYEAYNSTFPELINKALTEAGCRDYIIYELVHNERFNYVADETAKRGVG